MTSTWLFNDHIADDFAWNSDPVTYYISFISNGAEFSSIRLVTEDLAPRLYYDNTYIALGDRRGTGVNMSASLIPDYLTITLLENPTENLLLWLEQNAVRQ